MPEKTRNSAFIAVTAWCLAVLAIIGAWVGIGIRLDAACIWMSVPAAYVLHRVLRFAGAGRAWPHVISTATGIIIALLVSQWLIAADAFGQVMGLSLRESARQIGFVLAWEFSWLRFSQADGIWILVSMALALKPGLFKAEHKPDATGTRMIS